MPRTLPLGIVHDLPPIPHDPERTTTVQAGPLTFGIEYRIIDAASAAQHYTPEQLQASAVSGALTVHPDEGFSVHVFDATDGQERLRFDCFADDPHYHYLVPGVRNHAVAFDDAANGPFPAWVMARLRDRLPELLVEAGADQLAEAVRQADLSEALAAVETLVTGRAPSAA